MTSSVDVLKNLILDTAYFLVPVFGFCGFGDFEAVLHLWKFRHRVPATGALIELVGNVFLCHGRDCLSPHCREVIDMIELAPNNRLPYVNGTVEGAAATHRNGEPSHGPAAPTASCERVATPEQDSVDVLSTAMILLVRHRLERHPHFRGRTSLFTIERVGQTIAIKGRVPSYYLKQLLQEAIKTLPGVVNIDNQVRVIWPNS